MTTRDCPFVRSRWRRNVARTRAFAPEYISKFLLDTNTVSELMRANPVVLAELTRRSRGEVVVPQPVVAEIEFGLAVLPSSKRKKGLVQRWALFSRELLRLSWNDAVSVQFAVTKAQLRSAGSIIEDMDIAVAAHALAWDLVLVTNNTSHFRRIKILRLADWTSAPQPSK